MPKPRELISEESREAFYELLTHVRAAETDRELMLYMERFLEAQTEWRALFTLIEGETLRKLKEFREQTDRHLAEQVGGVRHIEPTHGEREDRA